jgi:hypothetical protein
LGQGVPDAVVAVGRDRLPRAQPLVLAELLGRCRIAGLVQKSFHESVVETIAAQGYPIVVQSQVPPRGVEVVRFRPDGVRHGVAAALPVRIGFVLGRERGEGGR